jgi:hypothetical protein
MEKILTDLEYFDTLILSKVYEYYDFPRVFKVVDEDGNEFFAMNIADNERETRWQYVELFGKYRVFSVKKNVEKGLKIEERPYGDRINGGRIESEEEDVALNVGELKDLLGASLSMLQSISSAIDIFPQGSILDPGSPAAEALRRLIKKIKQFLEPPKKEKLFSVQEIEEVIKEMLKDNTEICNNNYIHVKHLLLNLALSKG